MTKTLLHALAGALLGPLLVACVGGLSIQAVGIEGGAVIGLDNAVVGVTRARLPLLPLLGIAVVCALTVWGLRAAIRRATRGAATALLVGFVTTTAGAVVLALVLAHQRAEELGPTVGPVGVVLGWRGWAEEGGMSSAVHVVLALAVGMLVLLIRSRRAQAGPSTT